jgi:hypothetical protein
MHHARVALVEDSEGGAVAALRGAHQRGVVHRRGRGGLTHGATLPDSRDNVNGNLHGPRIPFPRRALMDSRSVEIDARPAPTLTGLPAAKHMSRIHAHSSRIVDF